MKLNGLANLSYAKRLEILGLDSLQTRRIKSDLVLCYSIVQFMVTALLILQTFVLRNTSIITRGHNFKLYKPLCNLNVRKYSFVYRVVQTWNCLSSYTVSTDNICTFRTKLDSLDLS